MSDTDDKYVIGTPTPEPAEAAPAPGAVAIDVNFRPGAVRMVITQGERQHVVVLDPASAYELGTTLGAAARQAAIEGRRVIPMKAMPMLPRSPSRS